MSRIDAHAATRNLVENAFRHLTWHEGACKAVGFKGISQIWRDEPAWYFWLDSVEGGYMLRLHGDESVGENQFISLSLHFYPAQEAEDLSPEESRLIADSRVFDILTHTPRFEHFDACLPYFMTAEIGMMIGAENQLQMLVYSTGKEAVSPSAEFFDLLVKALNFEAKLHHVDALQFEGEEESSLFLVYDRSAFREFREHFGLAPTLFQESGHKALLSGWKKFTHLRVDCSMKGPCGCH